MKDYPKVSIITVCYNCKDTIERTICNVLKQTYHNLEYIVIDGNSTDGTKEIIKRYANQLTYFVSEPDSGIYDAMNKGVRKATGEWVMFRNSGDYFFSPTTVQEVFDWYVDNGESFIVGGTRNFCLNAYMDEYYERQNADVWQQAFIAHHSTFIRLSVQKENLYPTCYRIASDYFFFQKMLLEGARLVAYKGIVSLFESENGISTRLLYLSWKERLDIRKQLGAPDDVLKKTRRICLTKFVVGNIIRCISWNKRLYQVYRQKHQLRNWVRQPMDVTLKNV